MTRRILWRIARSFARVCRSASSVCTLYPPAELWLASVCVDAIFPAIAEGVTEIIATATRSAQQTNLPVTIQQRMQINCVKI